MNSPAFLYNRFMDSLSDIEDIEMEDYHVRREFSGLEFSESGPRLRNYSFEDCLFKSCRFDSADITGASFSRCRFVGCTFMVTELADVSLSSVSFEDCKLAALNFTDCNRFGFSPSFKSCFFDNVAFSRNELKKTPFTGSRFRNVDFNDCNLTQADFRSCRFENALFHQCNLSESDFRAAEDYRISPADNTLTNALFNLPEAVSFLGFLGIRVE